MIGVTLPAVWIGPGIPGVRDCDGTYCETPLEDLPLMEVTDDLEWLKPLHAVIDAEMSQFRPSAMERQRYAQNVRTILTQANEQGIKLPKAFVELIQSEALQDRFPSPTACYFDLPERIVRAPFGLGGHIIRFLNDSQTCVVWYLHLPTDGAALVIASAPVSHCDERGEEEVVYFLEELDGHDRSIIADAAAATRIVSRTFPEFLYRYWLEGSIWFKGEHGIALTPEEAAYLGNA